MDMRAAMDGMRAACSAEHVCRVARGFLASCGWELEAGAGLIRVPPDAEFAVFSTAVIVSDYGFGDHVETVVYLGVGGAPPNVWPVHGVLRLYLDPAGRMITEDRYSRAEWLRG